MRHAGRQTHGAVGPDCGLMAAPGGAAWWSQCRSQTTTTPVLVVDRCQKDPKRETKKLSVGTRRGCVVLQPGCVLCSGNRANSI